MAHTNTKIYVDQSTDPDTGISIADIQTVLGSGRNDIGGLITYGNINENSVRKPVRSSGLASVAGTEALLAAANYGWEIVQKAAGGGTASFLNTLDNCYNNDIPFWKYNKPRGLNGGGQGVHEWYRFLDFNGYRHDAVPFGTPIFFNRLGASTIGNLEGESQSVVLPVGTDRAPSSTQWSGVSSNFYMNNAYNIQIVVSCIDPQSFSGYYPYVDGTFDYAVYDSNDRVVAAGYDTFSNSNYGQEFPTVYINFSGILPADDGYQGPFYIRYNIIAENQSYYMDGQNKVYFPVTLKIATPFAKGISQDYRGTEGIYIRTTPADQWDIYAKTAVFGESGWEPLCIVSVSDGTTRETAIVNPVAYNGYVLWSQLGITVRPRPYASDDDIIVYIVYGNWHQIFDDVHQIWYGPITDANPYRLLAGPQCVNKLGIIPTPPQPMSVYSDDFQGLYINGSNTYEGNYYDINANGITPRWSNLQASVNSLRIKWDIGVENCPIELPMEVHFLVLDGSSYDEMEFIANYTVPSGNSTVHIDIDTGNMQYNPDFEATSVKMWFTLAGETYYIRFYPQNLMQTDPGEYYFVKPGT